MKRFLLLPLLLFSPLFALPLGNPMSPLWGKLTPCCSEESENGCVNWCDLINLRLGFYGDYVFDRHMLRCDRPPYLHVDKTKIYTNAGLITVNLLDRLDIFGTLGTTNMQLTANPLVFPLIFLNSSRTTIDTDTHFSWSIGGRLVIWNCRGFCIGIEGQQLYTKPHITFISQPTAIFVNPDNDIKLTYRERQIGIGASYCFNMRTTSVVPYTGVKWAESKIRSTQAIGITNPFALDNEKHIGWALGTTVLFCDVLSLTVEGRWSDEKAVHINGQFCF